MQTISTITRGSKKAIIKKNCSHYIILATLNYGETTALTFSGKSWKTAKGATKAITQWLF